MEYNSSVEEFRDDEYPNMTQGVPNPTHPQSFILTNAGLLQGLISITEGQPYMLDLL